MGGMGGNGAHLTARAARGIKQPPTRVAIPVQAEQDSGVKANTIPG